MSEAPPPPLKGVTVGLILVGFSVPLLWLLFVGATFGILFEGQAFLSSWSWDVIRVLWLVVLVMQIGGQLLCLGVPHDWRIRGSEVVANVLSLLQLTLSLVFLLELWPELQAPVMARLVVLLLWALRLVTAGVHLIFISNFAPQVGQEVLSHRAETLILILFVLPLFPLLALLSFWVVPTLTNLRFPINVREASLEVAVGLILMGLAFVAELVVLMRFTQLHLAVYHSIFRHQEAFAEKEKLERAGWVDETRP